MGGLWVIPTLGSYEPLGLSRTYISAEILTLPKNMIYLLIDRKRLLP